MGAFTIVSSDASTSVLQLEGEFDDADELERVLCDLAAGGRSVRLDMSGVTFFGSRGLGALMATRQVAITHGGELRIVAASPRVSRLLDLTDLEHVLSPASDAGASSHEPTD